MRAEIAFHFTGKCGAIHAGGLRLTASGRRCDSRSEVFCKKGILKNLAKFTGKHLLCNASKILMKNLRIF